MRSRSKAFDRVLTIASWPMRSSKLAGRYLRARTRYGADAAGTSLVGASAAAAVRGSMRPRDGGSIPSASVMVYVHLRNSLAARRITCARLRPAFQNRHCRARPTVVRLVSCFETGSAFYRPDRKVTNRPSAGQAGTWRAIDLVIVPRLLRARGDHGLQPRLCCPRRSSSCASNPEKKARETSGRLDRDPPGLVRAASFRT